MHLRKLTYKNTAILQSETGNGTVTNPNPNATDPTNTNLVRYYCMNCHG